MNEISLTLAASWVLIAVLLIIQPWLTRKNVLFGVVFGNDNIWKDKNAKQIRQRYLRAMILGTVCISILLILYFALARPAEGTMMAAYFIGIVALLVFGTAVFIAFHAQTRTFKTSQKPDDNLVSEKISVETSLSDKRTVISAAWLLLFFPILIATYAVAIAGYSAMPAKIPTHYSFTAADAWAAKSWPTVLIPLITETILAAVLFVFCLLTRRAPASVRGNPEAAPQYYRFRKYIITLMILLGLSMEISFLFIEVGFFKTVSPILFNVPIVLNMILTVVIIYIYFRFVRIKKPKGPILDDDAKWVLGMFYYNPSDSSVFIEKRTGIGHSLNFARPAAWIILIGIFVFVVGSIIASSH